MKKFILLCLFPSLCFGVTGFGTGEDKDCLVAEQKAHKNAVIDSLGIEVDSTNKRYCIDSLDKIRCNFIKDESFYANGSIVEVLDLDVENKDGICKVSVVAEIERPQFLNVTVRGKTRYYNGQYLDFKVKPKQKMFMHIFNVHDKGTSMLYPFTNASSNLVDENYNFKDNEYLLRVNRSRTNKEKIIFLFTTFNIDFRYDELNEVVLKDVIDNIPNYSKRVFEFKISVRWKYEIYNYSIGTCVC